MNRQGERNPYEDIIHLPHHQSATRPHMSLYDRAAQFSPFAALTGFDGVIAETSRLTDQKIELSEYEKALLDQKLSLIDDELRKGNHPEIAVVYFVPDPLKAGGAYEESQGTCETLTRLSAALYFLPGTGGLPGSGSGLMVSRRFAVNWWTIWSTCEIADPHDRRWIMMNADIISCRYRTSVNCWNTDTTITPKLIS